MLALPVDALLGNLIVAPPESVVEAFDDIVATLVQRRWSLAAESRNLGILRDHLLPALVSPSPRRAFAPRSAQA